MPTNTESQNRHPVDRLNDIRDLIKALEAEADVLKSDILRTENYVGDDYLAVPKTNSRKSLDRPTLEKRFGAAAVAECCKESVYQTLNLFRKSDINRG